MWKGAAESLNASPQIRNTRPNVTPTSPACALSTMRENSIDPAAIGLPSANFTSTFDPWGLPLVNTLILAFAVFIVVRMVNNMKARMAAEEAAAPPPPPPPPSKEAVLLGEIRDLLRQAPRK